MSAEVGGAQEEKAAEFIAGSMTKPVAFLHRRAQLSIGQAYGSCRSNHPRIGGHGRK